MRRNKWEYVWVIQYKYENLAWEDVNEYEKKDRKWALHDLREYILSGGRYRLIGRRIKAYGD